MNSQQQTQKIQRHTDTNRYSSRACSRIYTVVSTGRKITLSLDRVVSCVRHRSTEGCPKKRGVTSLAILSEIFLGNKSRGHRHVSADAKIGKSASKARSIDGGCVFPEVLVDITTR